MFDQNVSNIPERQTGEKGRFIEVVKASKITQNAKSSNAIKNIYHIVCVSLCICMCVCLIPAAQTEWSPTKYNQFHSEELYRYSALPFPLLTLVLRVKSKKKQKTSE